MEKFRSLNTILETGIISVIRADNVERAVELAKAVAEGGIKAIEVAFTVPQAHQALEKLSNIFAGSGLLLGAGTVLDAETARIAILSGAEFIVCPHTNVEVIKVCNRYQKVVLPGAMTVTEVVNAMEAGGDMIKLFPSSVFGPKVISAIRGPLPHAPLVPTGGITLDNVKEWIKAGAVAVGVGGELTKVGQNGDYKKVTETAWAFVTKIKEAREN
ncbi:bifunctional 2-keto-4-hydroxyglutarate aldolase/2-keto-3-deoxy-6-phosphogluconate aldolase [Calderihabitans maritimus]|uniref:2-dehydro-3-deoxyphosphogluconate aldolase n=1 Tax=Calderihabitans maritimus TaxID=1246530 RepID=A0A1Z5HRJ9_9FIRM|nr:bifunctional 2-keto-4-hydroxyglutarate aldolase/2-keto-3-deoxy-6-phosphogluconate aldolase [Calderihabitans maritimus]GAW91951.1 2-dehydro-3-deoxyphosphogluconate aldolase [Calderihabitans maritimus]